jgi:tripartite-type tricarboxylate transporter receptor subunit TctC
MIALPRRALLAAPFLSRVAFAQGAYPNRSVRIILPFAPGGSVDFVARILQPSLQELLGQPMILENRTGAAGSVGLELAARQPPDGYNLVFGNVGSLAVNPTVYARTMKVDVARDLAPISLAGNTPDVLVVHPDVPARNVAEFIALVRTRPGQLNYASPGAGSLNRLEMELFREAVGGLDMVHVPYPAGAGPAVLAIVGGDVQALFTTVPSCMQQILAGRLRALAVTTAQRVPGLPSVPTLAESGFPEFVTGSWQGLLAPAGTPPEIIQQLVGVVHAAMRRSEVRQRLEAGGVVPDVSPTPADFAAMIAREERRWGALARLAGVTVE